VTQALALAEVLGQLVVEARRLALAPYSQTPRQADREPSALHLHPRCFQWLELQQVFHRPRVLDEPEADTKVLNYQKLAQCPADSREHLATVARKRAVAPQARSLRNGWGAHA